MELEICVVGAGFSGIATGIQLRQQLGHENFVIFDENEDVGGTWLVNKYPGCACDVPSHLYSYSFEPNPNWSYAYSPQEEIWRYLQHVAKKYDLYEKIKFHQKVTKLVWDEAINKWRVTVLNKRTQKESELQFNVVISGIGGLRVPHTPEEFLAFKGKRIHSAEWDTKVKLENKTVAVVGSGASAVQIIPSIAKKVKSLVAYQRHPAWVLPRFQFPFPEWMKWSFANVPGVRETYRSLIFWTNEIMFPSFIQGSIMQKIGSAFGNHYLKQQLGHNPELMEKVRPNYMFGCKRITPSNEYYRSLDLPHVEVIRSEIKQVKPNSIVTKDGKERKIDVLILATGFKVQDFYSPLEIRAKGGSDLMPMWKKDGPSAFMGICSDAVPNLFFLIGPNSGLGHNSIIFMLECQLNYVLQVIREMKERQATVASVKPSVEKAWMSQIMEDMKRTVWAAGCDSWYANDQGVVTALSPYSLLSTWRYTRKLNSADFKFY